MLEDQRKAKHLIREYTESLVDSLFRNKLATELPGITEEVTEKIESEMLEDKRKANGKHLTREDLESFMHSLLADKLSTAIAGITPDVAAEVTEKIESEFTEEYFKKIKQDVESMISAVISRYDRLIKKDLESYKAEPSESLQLDYYKHLKSTADCVLFLFSDDKTGMADYPLESAGSLFEFTVGPITGGSSHKVHAAGPGLVKGEIEQPCDFNIYTPDAGSLSIAFDGPSKAEIQFDDKKDGSCGVVYTVTEPGDYLISIKFNNEHISDSPFRVPVTPSIGDARKLPVWQFQDKGLQVGRPAAFSVHFNGAKGNLTAKVVPPSGIEDEALIQEVDGEPGKGSGLSEQSRVVVETVTKTSTMTKFKGIQKCDSDASNIQTTGTGLTKAYHGKNVTFAVDTANAGSHNVGSISKVSKKYHSNPVRMEHTFPLALTYMSDPKKSSFVSIRNYISKYFRATTDDKIKKALKTGIKYDEYEKQGNTYTLLVDSINPNHVTKLVDQVNLAILATNKNKAASARLIKKYIQNYHPNLNIDSFASALQRSVNGGLLKLLSGIGALGSYRLVNPFIPSPRLLAGTATDSDSDESADSDNETDERYVPRATKSGRMAKSPDKVKPTYVRPSPKKRSLIVKPSQSAKKKAAVKQSIASKAKVAKGRSRATPLKRGTPSRKGSAREVRKNPSYADKDSDGEIDHSVDGSENCEEDNDKENEKKKSKSVKGASKLNVAIKRGRGRHSKRSISINNSNNGSENGEQDSDGEVIKKKRTLVKVTKSKSKVMKQSSKGGPSRGGASPNRSSGRVSQNVSYIESDTKEEILNSDHEMENNEQDNNEEKGKKKSRSVKTQNERKGKEDRTMSSRRHNGISDIDNEQQTDSDDSLVFPRQSPFKSQKAKKRVRSRSQRGTKSKVMKKSKERGGNNEDDENSGLDVDAESEEENAIKSNKVTERRKPRKIKGTRARVRE